jgi:hypothetical protein
MQYWCWLCHLFINGISDEFHLVRAILQKFDVLVILPLPKSEIEEDAF